MYKKWFFVITLPILPAVWFYVYLIYHEGRVLISLGPFLLYLLCLGVSYVVVEGIAKLYSTENGIQKSLVKGKRALQRAICVGMLISAVVFTLIPLLRVNSELTSLKAQYTIHISSFNLIVTLVLGLYLLSELSKIGK